jgi:subtilisin family serine protease
MIRSRQARVLDKLQRTGFRLTHRYEAICGFAGWADRQAIAILERDPRVETVYLDGTLRAALAEGVALVGADLVHADGFTGLGVNVAVLDTGMDTDHPDLASSLVAERCFCTAFGGLGCCPDASSDQSGPGSAEDDAGHGTRVAGIITSDGVISAPGAAPDAGIVAVKVFDSGGAGSFSDVAAGLDWVLTNHATLGIRVVNLSLSFGGEFASPLAFPCTGTNVGTGIQALEAAGVAVFAASGNDGFDAGISFPACVAGAISVGGVYDAALGTVGWGICSDAATAPDVFACTSNSGAILDLVAPSWRTDTPTLGGGTTGLGGTSAASPYAAAQAALLLQAQPSLSPSEILTALAASGPNVTNPDNGLSFPRADVKNALDTLLANADSDGDGVLDDGDASGTAGDAPCTTPRT